MSGGGGSGSGDGGMAAWRPIITTARRKIVRVKGCPWRAGMPRLACVLLKCLGKRSVRVNGSGSDRNLNRGTGSDLPGSSPVFFALVCADKCVLCRGCLVCHSCRRAESTSRSRIRVTGAPDSFDMMVSCRTVDARSRNSTRTRSSAGMVRASLRPYIVEGISIMWDTVASSRQEPGCAVHPCDSGL